MPRDHTVRAFDADLDSLRHLVLELGRLTARQIDAGLDSLVRADATLAGEVALQHARLDALRHTIDELVSSVLVRQHAVARDLREILAAGRIAGHLERCGGYARTIARRGMSLRRPLAASIVAEISWIRARLDRMLRTVLRAYEERDVGTADMAWASDDEIDALYHHLLQTILDDVRSDPSHVDDGAELLLAAKALERAGDHATDIAEEVHLMVTGTRMATVRKYNVLFLCTGNSARSIMAEVLVTALSNGRFQGYSAGSHPTGHVHPLAFETLSRRSLPVEGLRSKSWDEFAAPGAPRLDFVFTLCDKSAGETCPSWPGQPMTAHWGVEDPAATQGSHEENRRAFWEAASILRRRIELFLSLPIDRLDRMSLQKNLIDIGKR